MEPQDTYVNAKVDIIPTKVLSGEITLEEAYSRYAGKIGIKDYRNSIEAWAKNKGFKSISYYGQRATGKATGRVQNSKKSKLNNETFRNYRRN